MILAFKIASALAWALVVLAARVQRGSFYARFAAILVGLHTLLSCSLVRHVEPLFPAYAYLQLAVYTHFFFLARPRMRPLAYRLFISLPASFFAASTFLAIPWSLASAFGFTPRALFVPYVLGLIGIAQSLASRPEEIDLVLDGASVEGLQRHASAPPREGRPLRLVQISDPHLGPFMPVARLRSICERAVARDPDLVLLTGDFLTMESQEKADHLIQALAPLAALRGRVFACHGNHDHEAPHHVAAAMKHIGAKLLIDDAAVAETPIGPVQIIGMDFHYRNRKEKMAEVCARHPRIAGMLRLVLLHDPGAFRHLPEGEGDLVLSGHTHGGQLGLLSLGVKKTILRLFVDMPDHGLWARGPDRLYVHRGTGHYGFPVRLGVPAEESVLRVHARGTKATSAA
ncbi:MAG: metallophosphoesterase [Byssovorax sp.]